jgi:hypothetical protein
VCKQENNMPNVSKIAKWTLTAFGFTGWNEARKNDRQIEVDFWYLF